MAQEHHPYKQLKNNYFGQVFPGWGPLQPGLLHLWAPVGVVTITGLVVLDTWLNVGVTVFNIRGLRGVGDSGALWQGSSTEN